VALTRTSRGTAGSNSVTSPNSNTTFVFSPASNLTAGALAVLCVSADNSGNASNNINSVADSLGNTWTKRNSTIYDPGSANAGIQGAIFTSPQDVGTLTTGSTITVTFGATTTAKSYTLEEWTGSVGTPAYKAQGAGTGAATASPTITSASIPNGGGIVAMVAMEAGTTQTCTEDADTTNGTWSTQQYSEVGSTTSGNCIASQAKVVTATATQTYNPTLGISVDTVCGWIRVGEDIAVTPTTAALTLTGYAPTVTAGSNVNVTPPTRAVVLAAFAPTVLAPRVCIPGIAALVLAAFAPTVVATSGVNVTPSTASLALTSYAPTVLTPIVVTPDPVGGSGSWPSGRTLHFDFSDVGTLTLTGNEITSAADQSGNGYDAEPTGGGEQPISEVDSIIGQAATFDGVDDSLLSSTGTVSAVTNATEWTLVARCQAASITSALSADYGDGVLHPPGAGPSITLRSDGAGDDRAYALNAYGWPPDAVYVSIDLSTELLLVARLTGGTLEIRNGNGTPSTMATGAGGGTTEGYRIGGLADAYLDGAISHVVCWDRALTEGEISTVLAILGGTAGPTFTFYAPTVQTPRVVTPPTAALTLTGYAPTVAAGSSVAVTPATATLALTGFAPTVLAPRVVVPTTASLALAGFAPTAVATAHVAVTPAIATLALSAFAPTVTAGASISVTPPPASLTLAGFAPTVLVPRVVAPSTATLALTSYAPSLALAVTPTTATLALAGFAPTIQTPRVCVPTTAALTLTGYAPTVTAASGLTVIPTTAALTLTAFAPTVLTPRAVTPATAALALSVFAPSVQTPRVVVPGAATVILAGFAPTVTASAHVAVTPATASLALAGFAPTVLTPRAVTPSMVALTLTGYAPTVTAASGLTVIPGTAALTLTAFAPTVQTPVAVTPSMASLALTGYAPAVTVGAVSVTPATVVLVLTAFAPTVAVTSIPQSPRPAIRQSPAWARDGMRHMLPPGFWRRWL
jgi:prolyl-tRNA editing enzyme YbaK/EbsC (Cys-tRNA(Pro) deacylase)